MSEAKRLRRSAAMVHFAMLNAPYRAKRFAGWIDQLRGFFARDFVNDQINDPDTLRFRFVARLQDIDFRLQIIWRRDGHVPGLCHEIQTRRAIETRHGSTV